MTYCYILGFFFLIAYASTVSTLQSEHISYSFYENSTNAEQAKYRVHAVLDNFIENFAKLINDSNSKLNLFSECFQQVSNVTKSFSQQSTIFFESAVNESINLLKKLRLPPMRTKNYRWVRDDLDEYYNDMENFNIFFSSSLYEASEFISDALAKTEETFATFSKNQNEIIVKRKLMNDEKCQKDYKSFLLNWTKQIFKCATSKIRVIYDVFAVSKYTSFDVIKILEHKIQKVFNCLRFDKYEFRCRFLKNSEIDFNKLITRMEELEMFLEKQRRKMYWNMQNQKLNKIVSFNCIPEKFPDKQMAESLRSCFYFLPYEDEDL